MNFKSSYLQRVYDGLESRNAEQKEFLQAVSEVLESLEPVVAANPKLENIINSAREQMYRYRYEYVKNPSVYAQLIAEHRAIIEGFNRRDVEYLKSIMHTHLSNQINAVREVIREQV